jgi:uncharacterized membrane protein (DUF373 family)
VGCEPRSPPTRSAGSEDERLPSPNPESRHTRSEYPSARDFAPSDKHGTLPIRTKLTRRNLAKGGSLFLLDVFRKQTKGRTLYEWFEQIILGLTVFMISLVIIYSLILATITLFEDFISGIGFMETGVLKDTFGLILTVIILVEFNHSIVLAIRQRSGAIQVRIVVLITIIVLARKLVLLDYTAASVETLLGLGGLALSLGGLYWLISDGEQRRRESGSTV